jgi:L-asparaginase II
MSTINPIIAEITRGTIVESRHRGAFAVCDSAGNVIKALGDVTAPIFPRSAIKAFQCYPLFKSGAVQRFALTDEEIALCCASHNGQPEHLRVAASLLAKAGCSEADLECGAHWPLDRVAAQTLVLAGQKPGPLHNCCSGKHAGMLILAKQLGVPSKNYTSPDHPVQKQVAETLSEFCGVDLATAPKGIDGCAVPTWAIPLNHVALGFAKLGAANCTGGQRIIAAVRKHPFMVAGTGKFDTEIMQTIPRLFIKFGAEGVYCGTIAHAGLGFALKCDDGAARAVEVAVAHMLGKLDCWTLEEKAALEKFARHDLSNWMKQQVGEARANF